MATTYEGTTEQARRIVHHHAVLRRGLERRVGTICAAVEHGVPHERPLATLREYLEAEILPHAEAEERVLYPAMAGQARGANSSAPEPSTANWPTWQASSSRTRMATGPRLSRNGSRRCLPGM